MAFGNGPERDKAMSRTGGTAQIEKAERKPGNADPGTEIAAEARREAPAHRKMCGKT